MKMNSHHWRTLRILGLACFFIGVYFASCNKENTGDDFRDNYVGSYTCTETYFYFDPIDDTILNWSSKVTATDRTVHIDKFADSSLMVSIGNSGFEARYESDNKFTCTECSGPDDYVKFFSGDSIYVYRKFGVTNSYDYYGKKN